MATLKDVAARAEVSVATAARVLRADPALVVRPATRARVQAAAAALAYHPNSAARGLRTRRSGTLAVFLPDPQNIMWLEMLRGIERAAAARDYLVVVADAHGPTLDPDQLGRLVLERRVDGLLVAFARVHDELVDQIASEALPFIAVNSQSATIAGSVTMDDAAGSRLAVEHLAGLGHRRIAFIGGRRDTDVGRRREAGYREALAGLGIPAIEPLIRAGDYTERTAGSLAAELLALPKGERPSAIYTVSLPTALGLLAAARVARIRVPEDVSVVTMDDHQLLDHVDPPLTAIRMPMARMGEVATGMLVEAIA
ncbi:MAG: LacI family DNA-binding transcriptional regulator, partial [Chloroflexota bacterium]